MKNDLYWKTRGVRATEALLNKSIKQTELELIKNYKRVRETILAKIEKLYAIIQKEAEDGTPLLSHLYSYNRYYELFNEVEAELSALGETENKILEKNLTNLYNLNSKEVGKQLGLQSQINKDQVRRAVNSVWVDDNLTFSQRIWNSMTQLKTELENGLVNCASYGASHKELTRTLMEKFDVSYHQAERLSRTELAHIQNESRMDRYKEAGVSLVRILVEHDGRQCAECEDLETTLYPVDQAPVLPLHPQCRCCYLAVIENSQEAIQ